MKNITRLASYCIKGMRPKFKTKMMIYQSKVNLDENILVDKITPL